MSNPPKAAQLAYHEVSLGSVYSFDAFFSKADIESYAKLSGDFNSLHIDSEYAKQQGFEKNIVHGLLASSLFSRLIGMYCPGANSLYLSQTLEFKRPIFPEEPLKVSGTVTQKTDSLKIVTLQTVIVGASGETSIQGQARAKFLRD